ncbi:MAG: hypothetical protein ACYTAN_14260 [Planctomycetota bacterium]
MDVVIYSYLDVATMTHDNGTCVYVWRLIHADLSEGWSVSMFTRRPVQIDVRPDCVVINGAEYRPEDGKRLNLTVFEDGSIGKGVFVSRVDRIELWMEIFYPPP